MDYSIQDNDMNNVLDTSRETGRKEGKKEGRLEERSVILDRQRASLLRLLPRRMGDLPNPLMAKINQLSLEKIEVLNEISWDFTDLSDLVSWLGNE